MQTESMFYARRDVHMIKSSRTLIKPPLFECSGLIVLFYWNEHNLRLIAFRLRLLTLKCLHMFAVVTNYLDSSCFITFVSF